MDNKKLKLYIGNKLIPFNHHSICFDIEKNNWAFTEVFDEADIIPVFSSHNTDISLLKKIYKPTQILLILDIFHCDSNHGNIGYISIMINVFTDITKKIIYVHQNKKNKNIKFAYVDIMFNREKLYFTEYDNVKNLDQKTWTTFSNKEMYTLSPINKISNKKFLAPIRIYNNVVDEEGNRSSMSGRMIYRKKLYNLLSSFLNDGWISNNENFDLLPNSPNNNFIMNKHTCGSGFYPVSDFHYNNSIISIYVETIIDGKKLTLVTEKTFDPLIKGNFILPFGHQYQIECIKDYGFKFPKWIDYSYDDIENLEERFLKYCQIVNNLLLIPQNELYKKMLENIDILNYNRQLFFNTPYISLYDNTIKSIKHNEENNWGLYKTLKE